MKVRSARLFRNKEHGDDRYLRYRRNKAAIFAVLDGVSSSSGSAASHLAKKWILHRKPALPDGIVACVHSFHDWITRHVGDEAQTTFTACLVCDGSVHTISVGDSPAFLIDEDSIRQLNTLDRLPEEPNVVTQVIGAGSISPHHHTHELPASGYLVLCTDGVSDNLSKESLLSACIGRPSARTIVRRLKRMLNTLRKEGKGHVYEGFKRDDATAVVVRFRR